VDLGRSFQQFHRHEHDALYFALNLYGNFTKLLLKKILGILQGIKRKEAQEQDHYITSLWASLCPFGSVVRTVIPTRNEYRRRMLLDLSAIDNRRRAPWG
jgi:hypothetical protein